MAPTSAWEKTDVVGKILLGVAGLCLSGVLAWGEYEDRAYEASRKLDEEARLREESYAREFQTYYAMARQAQPNDQLALSDLDLASSIAQTLAAAPFDKPFYNDAVLALRARFAPRPLDSTTLPGPTGISPVGLQARESASAPDVLRSSDQWFAVIATYSLNRNGLRLATERARSVPRIFGCAEVWRTILSRNYAVVIGGVADRASALANAQRARAAALAPDAFTQANRQWVREVGCTPFPNIPRPAVVPV